MKHAVVVAHPNPESLTVSCASAYRQAAEAAGQQVILRDLYSIGFNPCLKATKVPGPQGYAAAADVAAERELPPAPSGASAKVSLRPIPAN